MPGGVGGDRSGILTAPIPMPVQCAIVFGGFSLGDDERDVP